MQFRQTSFAQNTVNEFITQSHTKEPYTSYGDALTAQYIDDTGDTIDVEALAVYNCRTGRQGYLIAVWSTQYSTEWPVNYTYCSYPAHWNTHDNRCQDLIEGSVRSCLREHFGEGKCNDEDYTRENCEFASQGDESFYGLDD